MRFLQVPAQTPIPASTPWFTGLLVAGFTVAFVATAVTAFGSQLVRINPVLAVVLNLVVVGGVAPTVWRWRRALVWRWVVYGSGAGVIVGWVAIILGAL